MPRLKHSASYLRSRATIRAASKKLWRHRLGPSLIVFLVSAAALLWAQVSSENINPQISSSRLTGDEFQVSRIIDGDTIEIAGGQLVRYIGMDTPEIASGNQAADCFADEATQKNSELVLGQTIRLVKDTRETDRFGRWLRYVFVGDTFVNAELVRQGFARAFSVPPDVFHQADFEAAEAAARDEHLGLWLACEGAKLEKWNTNNTPETAELEEMQSILKDHVPATFECDCRSNSLNCSDFASRQAAQDIYECCLVKTRQDIHWLDGDRDAQACEGWK